MVSTNFSSSMLTSSAAWSWDVDQTKELKVSESGSKAMGPEGRNLCQATLFSVASDKCRVATTAD